MANAEAMGFWTLRFSAVLAPVPVVELLDIDQLWGYGLIGPAIAATWATGLWQRRRLLARLDRPASAGTEAPQRLRDTAAIGPRAAEAHAERRDRALGNLIASIKNGAIEADLRIQLIQDLVELGGEDMAKRLAPVAKSSEVDVEVRLEAAEHMSRYSLGEAARALEAIATDPGVGDKYRLDAASALADRAAGPAAIALMQLVTDDRVSEYVRHSAANALRGVDRSIAVMALRHLAIAPFLSSRLRVICAEQLAVDNAADAADALWRLVKGVEAVMDYHLGLDAAEVLYGIDAVAGVEAYSVLAVDSCFDWSGRIEAAYRLGRLGVGDGFDLLSDFACADGLDDAYGRAALDRLFQLEAETGTLDPED